MVDFGTEQELNIIRGKMLVNKASQKELRQFLTYVSFLEGLLAEADCADFFGTEGWQHRAGLD